MRCRLASKRRRQQLRRDTQERLGETPIGERARLLDAYDCLVFELLDWLRPHEEEKRVDPISLLDRIALAADGRSWGDGQWDIV